MAFVVEKELKLNFLGDNWKEASITYNSLSYREMQDMATLQVNDTPGSDENTKSFDKLATLIQDKFLKGTAWNGEALVELTKDDLLDLPAEVINKSIELLSGAVDPNS